MQAFQLGCCVCVCVVLSEWCGVAALNCVCIEEHAGDVCICMSFQLCCDLAWLCKAMCPCYVGVCTCEIVLLCRVARDGERTADESQTFL